MQQYPPTSDLLPPGVSLNQQNTRSSQNHNRNSRLPPIDSLPSKITRLDRKNHPYNKEIWGNSRVNQAGQQGTRASLNKKMQHNRDSLTSQSHSTGADTIESSGGGEDFVEDEYDESGMDRGRAAEPFQQGKVRRPQANTSHTKARRRRTATSGGATAKRRSRPRTSSQAALTTAPSSPQFITQEQKQERIQKKIQQSMQKSAKMSVYRLMQRRLLKEDYELNREQKRQEDLAYKHKQVRKWKKKLKKSPFAVDLLADSERVEEENRIRRIMAKKKKRMETKRLEQLKQNLLMNALLEEQQQMQQKMLHQQYIQQHQYRQQQNAEYATGADQLGMHPQDDYFYSDEQQGYADLADDSQHDFHAASYAEHDDENASAQNGGEPSDDRFRYMEREHADLADDSQHNFHASSYAGHGDENAATQSGGEPADDQFRHIEQERVYINNDAKQSIDANNASPSPQLDENFDEDYDQMQEEFEEENGGKDNTDKDQLAQQQESTDPYKEDSFLEEGNDDDNFDADKADFNLDESEFNDAEFQQFEQLESLQDLEKLRRDTLRRFSEGQAI
uniref:Uncharacterized protein n=1 Tax=Percolomonas cosmopolitus TaxID=63605 RepID=A0A7S1KTC3_9EUKA